VGEQDQGFVTEADLAQMGGDEDGGNEAGGGAPEGGGVLEEKFGGDATKLADAYENLERKLGEQGTELGQLRQLVEAGSKTKEKEVTEDDLVAALDEKIEAGELTQLQATQALNKFRDKKLHERLEKGDARAKSAEEKTMWQEWASGNQELSKNPVLDNVMARLVHARPHLLVRGKGQKALVESLDMILDLAKLEIKKAMARRGGNLDDGRSRRVVRTAGRSGRKGTSRVGGETLERALQTDNEADWGAALEGLFD